MPWELMIPSRRTADGQYQQLRPLGVQCAIGRWHGDDYVCPGQVVPLQDSLVLAPTYNPPLPQASAERDLILELFPGQSVPATFDELDAFYAAHTASLFHFVCHGRDATLQAIKLLQNQVLWANQVRPGGLGMACRKSRPLIFLNACEVGRPGAGLAAVGGFAASFIACDAGADHCTAVGGRRRCRAPGGRHVLRHGEEEAGNAVREHPARTEGESLCRRAAKTATPRTASTETRTPPRPNRDPRSWGGEFR